MMEGKEKIAGVTFNGSVTFNGPMFDIHDNQQVTIVRQDTAPGEKPVAAAKHLHAALEELRGLTTNNRQWFPVIKVLMWRGYVCDGDFAGAVAMIQQIIPDLRLDARDMSRMNVQSFSKPLERWDISDAPVGGNVFMQYRDIASKGMEIIPEKRS